MSLAERPVTTAAPAEQFTAFPNPQLSLHRTTSQDFSRRQELGNLLDQSRNLEIKRENHPGMVVLIPVHADSRVPFVSHTLDSIMEQGYTDPIRVVVADNGMSAAGSRDIQDKASSLGLQTTIVDAKPHSDLEKNAAHARNQGLSTLRTLASQDASFRSNGIVLLDSDTAMLPGALHEFDKIQHAHSAAAVTAASLSTPAIDRDARLKYFKETDIKSGEARLLPSLTQGGKVDIASLVAFGSDVAAKTCGVYIDRETMGKFDKPFIRMPNGSAEDMIFSVALGEVGKIMHAPGAVVLDMARETPLQVMNQRKNWGQDHAILFNDLAALGQVQNGIHVLEPDEGGWTEWIAPTHNTDIKGMMLNPEQLKQLAMELLYADHGEDPAVIQNGLDLLKKMTHYVDAARPTAQKRPRYDLPMPTVPDTSKTRFSKESMTGLLAGNILGIHSTQDMSSEKIPQSFFFGVRQSTVWGT